MATNRSIKVNEADFSRIKKNFKTYLTRTGSAFEDGYNFNTSLLNGKVEYGSYLIHYLAYTLNKNIEEIFLDTALMEDHVYSIIKNYNYIPKLRKPASSFLKLLYLRQQLDDTIFKVGVGEATGFALGDTLTGQTNSGTCIVDALDTVNDIVFVKDVSGTFDDGEIVSDGADTATIQVIDYILTLGTNETDDFAAGVLITGGTTGFTGTIRYIDSDNDKLLVSGATGQFQVGETITGGAASAALLGLSTQYDLYSSDDEKTFELNFNHFKYDTAGTYMAIPTYRDKWQYDYYDDASVTDFEDQNIANFELETFVDNDNNKRYLRGVIPVYQAKWFANEVIVDVTFEDEVILNDGSNSWDDRPIVDTIKVHVYEDSEGDWFEYKDIRTGIFDENQRNFVLEYVPDVGVKVIFNTQYISKELQNNDIIRIYYAVTEGDDVNEVSGQDEFLNTSFETVQITNTSDSVVIFDSSTYGTILTSGYADSFTSSLIDSLNLIVADIDYFDNGTARQTIESIKRTAPSYYSTQGRAITESDYDTILQRYFDEYSSIKAWGGEREFLDVQELLTDELVAQGNPTSTDGLATVLKNVMQQMYVNAPITIDAITDDDLDVGRYIRDLGHVYFSMFYPNFTFVDSDADINEVKDYLDDYKIQTIFLKYMPPTFAFLKLTMVLQTESAYTRSITSREIKERVRDYVNTEAVFNKIFYSDELTDEVRSYDEISRVLNVTYTIKTKNKKKSETEDILIRIYTPIASDLTANIEFIGGSTNLLTSSGGILYMDGIQCGSINKTSGLLKLSRSDIIANFGQATWDGIDEFYIDDISISGVKVNGVKDCIVGIENVSDVSIILS
jgi:hypothetical protein